ncbi:MAG: hypothetical protein HZC42_00735 [Candidatus Eisenbacteria bacterium]|nr:hypothetical protein [Candidatus Eisenbacteria bacterium]
MSGRVYLHKELAAILRARGNRWMTTKGLAEIARKRGRYQRLKPGEVTAFQVHGRTRRYSRIFEREGSRVRLRQ